MQRFTNLIAVFAYLAAISCSGAREEARMEKVHDLMYTVMDPAAEGIWDNAGWIITEAGEEELWPTTDQGWQEVMASADQVADTARLLQQPPYTTNGDWNEFADGLIVAAGRARQAAEARDKEELFDAGGHIYRVCAACHQRYMTEDHETMAEESGS